MGSLFTKKILIAYCLLWLVLAGLSIARYSAIVGGQCPFQTIGWLACTSDLNNSARTGLIAGVLILFGTFLFTARTLWKNVEIDLPLSVKQRGCLLVLSFLAVLVIPLGTSDWPYYFSTGRALSEGLNPYVDNWTMYIDYASPAVQSPLVGFSYGPIIAGLFQGLYAIGQGSALAFLFLWKIIMLATLWGAGWLTSVLAKKLSSAGSRQIEKIVWLAQPLLLFEWVVNGHFDGLWLLCVLGAIWAAHTKRWWLVLPVLVVGVWIKFIPILVLPFFALWWWQELTKTTWKQVGGQMVVGLVLATLITVVSWAPYWTGPEVFDSLVVQSKWAVTSVFAAIYYSLKPLFQALFADRAHLYLTSLAQGSLLVLFVATLWPLVRQGWKILFKKERWETGQYVQAMFVFLLVYLLLWQKSFWPWYGTWFIPLGLIAYAAVREVRVLKLTAWMSTVPIIHHIVLLVDALRKNPNAGSDVWFFWVIILVVMAYPLWIIFHWRKTGFSLAGKAVIKNI